MKYIYERLVKFWEKLLATTVELTPTPEHYFDPTPSRVSPANIYNRGFS